MTTIAAATSADLPALLELLGQSALPTAGLADHLDTTLVAREAGHVVGSAALELYGTTALLRSVAVPPRPPGPGVGPGLTRPAISPPRPPQIPAGYLPPANPGGVLPRFSVPPTPPQSGAPPPRPP